MSAESSQYLRRHERTLALALWFTAMVVVSLTALQFGQSPTALSSSEAARRSAIQAKLRRSKFGQREVARVVRMLTVPKARTESPVRQSLFTHRRPLQLGKFHGSDHFSQVSNFLRDQAALDNSESDQMMKVKQNRNLAEGYGLAATLEENENVADGSVNADSSIATALKSADASIAEAGFGDASRQQAALLGHQSGHAIASQMEISGARFDRETQSLKRALLLSKQQLDKVLHDDNTATAAGPEDMGLGRLALNSVTQGLKAGLGVYRRNPIDGAAQGSLALVDDGSVDRLSAREMRAVVAGRLPVQATLVGLGKRP